jgi:hypothetical protein
VLLNFELARAKIAERVGDQSGNAHLRDSEPQADLRHVAAKCISRISRLPGGHLVPVRGDGLHAEHVLQRRIVLAD